MSTDNDFISTISQLAGNQEGPSLPDPFPNIPNPPEGFDPESSPIRTDSPSPNPPSWAKKKPKQKRNIKNFRFKTRRSKN